MSRLSFEHDDHDGNEKGQNPVDKDKKLGILVSRFVTETVNVVGGHDLFL